MSDTSLYEQIRNMPNWSMICSLKQEKAQAHLAKPLAKNSGSFENRAREISHKIIENGFQIICGLL
jgi:hypothetical protein